MAQTQTSGSAGTLSVTAEMRRLLSVSNNDAQIAAALRAAEVAEEALTLALDEARARSAMLLQRGGQDA